MNVNLVLFTAAAALCACNPAFAWWRPAVDLGTVGPKGILAMPGEGIVPQPGGNSREQTVTAFDGTGNSWPVIHGVNVTPNGYQGGGAIMTGYPETTAGFATPDGQQGAHAAVWANGRFTDLNPAGYFLSIAQGVGGNGNIVGTGQIGGGPRRAWLFVDNFDGLPGQQLPTPTGFYQAVASSVAEGPSLYVGGYALTGGVTITSDPIIWTRGQGTSYTAVDILAALPGSTSGRIAAGVSVPKGKNSGVPYFAGTVTTASSAGQQHAALWIPYAQGTKAVGYDLHPANKRYTSSSIIAIGRLSNNDVYEAGLVVIGSSHRTRWNAMVWKSSAASARDLSVLLPRGVFTSSVATGVDQLGDVEGAAIDRSGLWHEVYWPIN